MSSSDIDSDNILIDDSNKYLYGWIIGRLNESNSISIISFAQFTLADRPPNRDWFYVGMFIDDEMIVDEYSNRPRVGFSPLSKYKQDLENCKTNKIYVSADNRDHKLLSNIHSSLGCYNVSGCSYPYINGRYMESPRSIYLEDAPVYRNVYGWVIFRKALKEIPILGIFADNTYNNQLDFLPYQQITERNALLAYQAIISRTSSVKEGSSNFLRKFAELKRADKYYNFVNKPLASRSFTSMKLISSLEKDKVELNDDVSLDLNTFQSMIQKVDKHIIKSATEDNVDSQVNGSLEELIDSKIVINNITYEGEQGFKYTTSQSTNKGQRLETAVLRSIERREIALSNIANYFSTNQSTDSSNEHIDEVKDLIEVYRESTVLCLERIDAWSKHLLISLGNQLTSLPSSNQIKHEDRRSYVVIIADTSPSLLYPSSLPVYSQTKRYCRNYLPGKHKTEVRYIGEYLDRKEAIRMYYQSINYNSKDEVDCYVSIRPCRKHYIVRNNKVDSKLPCETCFSKQIVRGINSATYPANEQSHRMDRYIDYKYKGVKYMDKIRDDSIYLCNQLSHYVIHDNINPLLLDAQLFNEIQSSNQVNNPTDSKVNSPKDRTLRNFKHEILSRVNSYKDRYFNRLNKALTIFSNTTNSISIMKPTAMISSLSNKSLGEELDGYMTSYSTTYRYTNNGSTFAYVTNRSPPIQRENEKWANHSNEWTGTYVGKNTKAYYNRLNKQNIGKSKRNLRQSIQQTIRSLNQQHIYLINYNDMQNLMDSTKQLKIDKNLAIDIANLENLMATHQNMIRCIIIIQSYIRRYTAIQKYKIIKRNYEMELRDKILKLTIVNQVSTNFVESIVKHVKITLYRRNIKPFKIQIMKYFNRRYVNMITLDNIKLSKYQSADCILCNNFYGERDININRYLCTCDTLETAESWLIKSYDPINSNLLVLSSPLNQVNNQVNNQIITKEISAEDVKILTNNYLSMDMIKLYQESYLSSPNYISNDWLNKLNRILNERLVLQQDRYSCLWRPSLRITNQINKKSSYLLERPIINELWEPIYTVDRLIQKHHNLTVYLSNRREVSMNINQSHDQLVTRQEYFRKSFLEPSLMSLEDTRSEIIKQNEFLVLADEKIKKVIDYSIYSAIVLAAYELEEKEDWTQAWDDFENGNAWAGLNCKRRIERLVADLINQLNEQILISNEYINQDIELCTSIKLSSDTLSNVDDEIARAEIICQQIDSDYKDAQTLANSCISIYLSTIPFYKLWNPIYFNEKLLKSTSPTANQLINPMLSYHRNEEKAEKYICDHSKPISSTLTNQLSTYLSDFITMSTNRLYLPIPTNHSTWKLLTTRVCDQNIHIHIYKHLLSSHFIIYLSNYNAFEENIQFKYLLIDQQSLVSSRHVKIADLIDLTNDKINSELDRYFVVSHDEIKDKLSNSSITYLIDLLSNMPLHLSSELKDLITTYLASYQIHYRSKYQASCLYNEATNYLERQIYDQFIDQISIEYIVNHIHLQLYTRNPTFDSKYLSNRSNYLSRQLVDCLWWIDNLKGESTISRFNILDKYMMKIDGYICIVSIYYSLSHLTINLFIPSINQSNCLYLTVQEIIDSLVDDGKSNYPFNYSSNYLSNYLSSNIILSSILVSEISRYKISKSTIRYIISNLFIQLPTYQSNCYRKPLYGESIYPIYSNKFKDNYQTLYQSNYLINDIWLSVSIYSQTKGSVYLVYQSFDHSTIYLKIYLSTIQIRAIALQLDRLDLLYILNKEHLYDLIVTNIYLYSMIERNDDKKDDINGQNKFDVKIDSTIDKSVDQIEDRTINLVTDITNSFVQYAGNYAPMLKPVATTLQHQVDRYIENSTYRPIFWGLMSNNIVHRPVYSKIIRLSIASNNQQVIRSTNKQITCKLIIKSNYIHDSFDISIHQSNISDVSSQIYLSIQENKSMSLEDNFSNQLKQFDISSDINISLDQSINVQKKILLTNYLPTLKDNERVYLSISAQLENLIILFRSYIARFYGNSVSFGEYMINRQLYSQLDSKVYGLLGRQINYNITKNLDRDIDQCITNIVAIYPSTRSILRSIQSITIRLNNDYLQANMFNVGISVNNFGNNSYKVISKVGGNLNIQSNNSNKNKLDSKVDDNYTKCATDSKVVRDLDCHRYKRQILLSMRLNYRANTIWQLPRQLDRRLRGNKALSYYLSNRLNKSPNTQIDKRIDSLEIVRNLSIALVNTSIGSGIFNFLINELDSIICSSVNDKRRETGVIVRSIDELIDHKKDIYSVAEKDKADKLVNDQIIITNNKIVSKPTRSTIFVLPVDEIIENPINNMIISPNHINIYGLFIPLDESKSIRPLIYQSSQLFIHNTCELLDCKNDEILRNYIDQYFISYTKFDSFVDRGVNSVLSINHRANPHYLLRYLNNNMNSSSSFDLHGDVVLMWRREVNCFSIFINKLTNNQTNELSNNVTLSASVNVSIYRSNYLSFCSLLYRLANYLLPTVESLYLTNRQIISTTNTPIERVVDRAINDFKNHLNDFIITEGSKEDVSLFGFGFLMDDNWVSSLINKSIHQSKIVKDFNNPFVDFNSNISVEWLVDWLDNGIIDQDDKDINSYSNIYMSLSIPRSTQIMLCVCQCHYETCTRPSNFCRFPGCRRFDRENDKVNIKMTDSNTVRNVSLASLRELVTTSHFKRCWLDSYIPVTNFLITDDKISKTNNNMTVCQTIKSYNNIYGCTFYDLSTYSTNIEPTIVSENPKYQPMSWRGLALTTAKLTDTLSNCPSIYLMNELNDVSRYLSISQVDALRSDLELSDVRTNKHLRIVRQEDKQKDNYIDKKLDNQLDETIDSKTLDSIITNISLSNALIMKFLQLSNNSVVNSVCAASTADQLAKYLNNRIRLLHQIDKNSNRAMISLTIDRLLSSKVVQLDQNIHVVIQILRGIDLNNLNRYINITNESLIQLTNGLTIVAYDTKYHTTIYSYFNKQTLNQLVDVFTQVDSKLINQANALNELSSDDDKITNLTNRLLDNAQDIIIPVVVAGKCIALDVNVYRHLFRHNNIPSIICEGNQRNSQAHRELDSKLDDQICTKTNRKVHIKNSDNIVYRSNYRVDRSANKRIKGLLFYRGKSL